MPFPGTYIVDTKGIVLSKYFEQDHRERNTASSLVTRTFGSNATIEGTELETPHLRLRYSASDKVVYPGSLALLTVEIEVKPGMHVYAPGAQGYKPIDWTTKPSPGWLARPVAYPPSHMLRLPEIDETVPVYEGRFRLSRDSSSACRKKPVESYRMCNALRVEDVFYYQACDDRTCYPPRKLDLHWTFTLSDHDRKRAPEQYRKQPSHP